MMLASVRSSAIASEFKKRQPEENLFQRVEIEGAVLTLPVYKIPTRLLYFNIRNGRFAAELKAKEKQLGRVLDPTKQDDEDVIRSLLLSQNEGETEVLKKDLLKHDQIDPGIITHDGAIINANRRMAVITSLFKETRDPKWEYLKVAILPTSVGEQDLWRIEAGLQFAKDFRLEYGAVNELLKLREGVSCGLKPEDISTSLLGRYSPNEVKIQLEILELIDSYLVAINKPGEYEQITGKTEHFKSLQKNVLKPLEKQEFDSLERLWLMQVAFGLIQNTDHSHWDIRKLLHVAKDEKAFTEFKQELADSETPLQASEDNLNEAFQAGIDLIEDRKQKDKPEKLIRRATSAIESIDPHTPQVASISVQKLLINLSSLIQGLIIPVK